MDAKDLSELIVAGQETSKALVVYVNGQAKTIDASAIVEHDNYYRRPRLKYDDKTLHAYRGDFGIDVYAGRAAAFIQAGFFADLRLFPGQPGRNKTSETFAAPQGDDPAFVSRIAGNGNVFYVQVTLSKTEQERQKAERERIETESRLKEAKAKEAEVQRLLNSPRVSMSQLSQHEQELIKAIRLMAPSARKMILSLAQTYGGKGLKQLREEAEAARAKARGNFKLVAINNNHTATKLATSHLCLVN
jgi:hypothetical protein